jgi:ubiquinone/menaquinone biosynthesis C-methylase UbiE
MLKHNLHSSNTMSSTTYIHGTAPSEQARLAELNRLTNGTFIEFLNVEPNTRVLEVGSGLGILAAEVAAAAAGVRVVGLEYSADQIAAAARSPAVEHVQGDAHELPFEPASFDLVYARYLLEHVADPARVVAEMRRVLRPGGRIAVMENDVTLIRFDPPCPAFDQVWARFAEYQQKLGGDGLVGRRLFRLLKNAGFERIELSFQPEVHWSGSPGFRPWVVNIIGNVESARQGLVESGLCHSAEIAAACEELAALADRADASATFSWNRARARR